MRLVVSNKMANKLKLRLKKKVRVRKKIFGLPERPRLSVFRSGNHIYAQIVDDMSGRVVCEASTRSVKVSEKAKGCEAATQVGAAIAKKALDKKVSSVVFDRGGFLYHGRVKSLAEAAREAGLKF